ncbi:hypothetical protein M5K25_028077 [Dendrobium thyrsiflorum]|uniref:Secreted protein n=1 Tax=Dendrobium thyrsiflorum TaxID=117978 RepID=A0ABD0TVJ1_DENTH
MLSTQFLYCLLIFPADYLNSPLLFGLPMVDVWFPHVATQFPCFLDFPAAGSRFRCCPSVSPNIGYTF